MGKLQRRRLQYPPYIPYLTYLAYIIHPPTDIQYSTDQYSTGQYSTDQYSTVQYIILDYITLHYITLHTYLKPNQIIQIPCLTSPYIPYRERYSRSLELWFANQDSWLILSCEAAKKNKETFHPGSHSSSQPLGREIPGEQWLLRRSNIQAPEVLLQSWWLQEWWRSIWTCV